MTRRFAHAIAQLKADGHRMTLVHGGSKYLQHTLNENGPNRNGHGAVAAFGEDPLRLAAMLVIGKLNKELVASLGAANVPALGLCGSDAHMIRTRSSKDNANKTGAWAEVAAVDPAWLDIISRNGAVPVLAAVNIDSEQHHCALAADQTAGACAIAWDADALIFVTNAEIPRHPDGSLMRWIDSSSLRALGNSPAASCAMTSKLEFCKRALEHGVRRARILPASEPDSLASFYFSRIESGTEVVLTSRKLDRAVVDQSL